MKPRADPSPELGAWVACGGALLAFAANSLLARQALGPRHADPAAYVTVRLGSGAAALAALSALLARSAPSDRAHAHRPGRRPWAGAAARDRWVSAGLLVTYAAAFAWAYQWLDAGIGALILFAAVQVTMVLGGAAQGPRPAARQLIGIAVALGGLAVLTGAAPWPPPWGGGDRPLGPIEPGPALAMAAAGAAWGGYSLRARAGPGAPLRQTWESFARAAGLAFGGWAALALVGVGGAGPPRLDGIGWACALGSGAVGSGLGYVLWYRAVPTLGATRAAAAQLAVPLLAALGGIALLAEPWSVRLLGAGFGILSGLALSLPRDRAAGP